MRLTDEQAHFAMGQFTRWLLLKEQHEPGDWIREGHRDRRWRPGHFSQLRADIDHSALLLRLLRGREPLPEPPPLAHAYPVYPDWPYADE